jgi:hypothetical protein
MGQLQEVEVVAQSDPLQMGKVLDHLDVMHLLHLEDLHDPIG